ncbi:hypothetical protein [Alteromonas stellipolaris]|uniref:hypothetical protein n=1 Tax=Alteromonas stellipolaris TaxID=233316 RepID=UPI002734F54E|nr:hypothetical protein [Alteromonas stellipolaris]MDP2597668.1 hypothetical protein [Alteromonas stellipolaris]
MKARIKALVLTYDKQIGLAQLLIKKYVSLGLGRYFTFIVPVNSLESRFKIDGAEIEFVLSESDILSTMESLLNQVEDNEWIYWAIDDRYPMEVECTQFKVIFDALNTDMFRGINGVKLLPWREPLAAHKFSYKFINLQSQEPKSMFGFWHHHFLRSKVLKAMFLSENKHRENNIRLINNLYRDEDYLPFLEAVYVVDSPIIELAEPLFNGKLTLNGYRDLKTFNCELPDYKVIDDNLAFYDCDEQMTLAPNKPKFVGSEYFEK